MFILICYHTNITIRPSYCHNISYHAVPFSTTYYHVTTYHTFSTPCCHVISYCNVTLHHIILSAHRTVTLYHIMLSPLVQRTITLHHIILSAHCTVMLYHIIMYVKSYHTFRPPYCHNISCHTFQLIKLISSIV